MAVPLLPRLQEFFLLERAAQTAGAYTPLQLSRIVELRGAALERLREARRTSSTLAACALSREAVAILARASALARDGSLDDRDLGRLDVSAEIPDLGPELDESSTGDRALIREALETRDPLHFDRLRPESLARLRLALDRAAGVMFDGVEVRSLLHIHALRWGRRMALGIAVLYCLWLGVRLNFVPTNISAGKPVHATSRHPTSTKDESELVDGHTGTGFSVATVLEDSPSVEIDLLGNFAIDRINVFNRSDTAFDDCLPLVVEISGDHKTYTELGRREERFGFDVPWTVAGSNRVARYVRLRLARHGYLALGLVEVFGMKRRP